MKQRQSNSIETPEANKKYKRMIFTLGSEVIVAFIFLFFFSFVLNDDIEPFWKKEATRIFFYEISILFVFFVYLIAIQHENIKKIFESHAWNIFYFIGSVQILLLSFLVEDTYGLMLSPFTEFYALIFLTVLILTKSATRAVYVFTPITFYCITRNFTIDIISHYKQPLVINTWWHVFHGSIFISILAILYIIDYKKDFRNSDTI